MTQYREGEWTQEEQPTTEPTEAQEEPSSGVESEDFSPPPGFKSSDVETAFLVVLTKDGRVFPVNGLENMQMARKASMHDMYRMSCDVGEQLSSLRIIGEVASITRKLLEQGLGSAVNATRGMLKESITLAIAQAMGLKNPDAEQGD